MLKAKTWKDCRDLVEDFRWFESDYNYGQVDDYFFDITSDVNIERKLITLDLPCGEYSYWTPTDGTYPDDVCNKAEQFLDAFDENAFAYAALTFIRKRIAARRILRFILRYFTSTNELHEYLWKPPSGVMYKQTWNLIEKHMEGQSEVIVQSKL